MYIKYKKVHEKAITPQRANPSDAGLDLFFCPEGDKIKLKGNFASRTWGGVETIETEKNFTFLQEVRLNPGENVIIPTGISLEIPHGFVGKVCNRSSVSAKKSLLCGAHIVDAGYSGEIFVDLHNIGFSVQTIKPGDKIAQILILPVMSLDLLEDTEIYQKDCVISNRKNGALGSTGL